MGNSSYMAATILQVFLVVGYTCTHVANQILMQITTAGQEHSQYFFNKSYSHEYFIFLFATQEITI